MSNRPSAPAPGWNLTKEDFENAVVRAPILAQPMGDCEQRRDYGGASSSTSSAPASSSSIDIVSKLAEENPESYVTAEQLAKIRASEYFKTLKTTFEREAYLRSYARVHSEKASENGHNMMLMTKKSQNESDGETNSNGDDGTGSESKIYVKVSGSYIELQGCFPYVVIWCSYSHNWVDQQVGPFDPKTTTVDDVKAFIAKWDSDYRDKDTKCQSCKGLRKIPPFVWLYACAGAGSGWGRGWCTGGVNGCCVQTEVGPYDPSLDSKDCAWICGECMPHSLCEHTCFSQSYWRPASAGWLQSLNGGKGGYGRKFDLMLPEQQPNAAHLGYGGRSGSCKQVCKTAGYYPDGATLYELGIVDGERLTIRRRQWPFKTLIVAALWIGIAVLYGNIFWGVINPDAETRAARAAQREQSSNLRGPKKAVK